VVLLLVSQSSLYHACVVLMISSNVCTLLHEIDTFFLVISVIKSVYEGLCQISDQLDLEDTVLVTCSSAVGIALSASGIVVWTGVICKAGHFGYSLLMFYNAIPSVPWLLFVGYLAGLITLYLEISCSTIPSRDTPSIFRKHTYHDLQLSRYSVQCFVYSSSSSPEITYGYFHTTNGVSRRNL
jgi:hypothetical protein